VFNEQLVVSNVMPWSSLHVSLFPGDKLIRINRINVTQWSLDDVAKRLEETSHLNRVLEVQRPPPRRRPPYTNPTGNSTWGYSLVPQQALPARKSNTRVTPTTMTRTSNTLGAATATATSRAIHRVPLRNPPGAQRTATTTSSDEDRDPENPSSHSDEWKKRQMHKFESEFYRLKLFKEKYGDTDVPIKRAVYRVGDKVIDQDCKRSCFGLGIWVVFIRKQLKLYEISPDASLLSKQRVSRLKGLGFCMEPIRGIGRSGDELLPSWNEERYQELLAFHEEHGHCSVSTQPKSALRDWADRIRLAHSDLQEGIVATITDEDIAKLRELGFDFSEKKRYTFEESFQKWREFKAANSGRDPPPHTRLGKWMTFMRKKYHWFQKGEKHGRSITEEQIDKLTFSGFQWESKVKKPVVVEKPKPFEERLEELEAYKQEYGDCLVPLLYPGLGNWVRWQRREFKNWKVKGKHSGMTQERYDKLIKVGFSFERRKMGPRFHKENSTGGSPHPLQNQLLLKETERRKRLALANRNSADAADDDQATLEAAFDSDRGDIIENGLANL
jgi:hypothetical protein